MDRFIKDREVNLENLQIVAKPLPKPMSFSNFAEQFGTDKKTVIHSPISDVVIDVKSQYYKMKTWKENRLNISGAIKETIEDPLFIIKHKGAIKYYAPYIDKNNLVHVISVTENKNEVDILKSNYEPFDLKVLKELLSIKKEDLLYIKDVGVENSIPATPTLPHCSNKTTKDIVSPIIIPKTPLNVKSQNNLDEAQEIGLHKGYLKALSTGHSIKVISTNEENKMAFVKLTNEKTPRLAVSVDNALNYQDKDGNLKQRLKETALTECIVEAGKVAAMGKGTVSLNVSIGDKVYQTYFVNRDEKHNISLNPAGDIYNKDKTIYCNYIAKRDGTGHFYAINNKTEAAQALLDVLQTKTVTRENGETSEYLKASVTLKNDELKTELVTMGKDHTAILSKDGIKIVKDIDLQKAVNKDKKVEVAKEKAPKEQSKGVER